MHSGGTNIVLNPFNGHLETKGFSCTKALAALKEPWGGAWLVVAKGGSCSSSNIAGSRV